MTYQRFFSSGWLTHCRVLITGLCLWALVACGNTSPPNMPNGSVIPLTKEFTGEFELVDTSGQLVRSSTFAGQPMLVYFGFTNCPDVCPAALGIMSGTLAELGRDASAIKPIFIGLDTQQDTPKALKEYLSFDPRIEGLSGDSDQMEVAKKGFRVYSQRVELPGSALGYSIDHSRFFYLTDKTGKPLFALKDSLPPDLLSAFVKFHLRKM